MNTQEGNQDKYSSKYVQPMENSPLAGKRLFFLGSSVTYGETSLQDGIPEYFARRFGCEIVKEAVSGTTLVDEEESSYIGRMERNVDIHKPMDLMICQLSTNDATQGKPMGKISTSMEGTSFDTLTVIGAMEYIIAYVKKHWNCPICFYTNARYDSEQYKEMVSCLYALKEKWEIGVLDLWSEDGFNDISQEERSLYMNDPIHPYKAGYMCWWCPEIERQLMDFLQ